MKQRFFEIIRFALVGGLSFAIDFGLLYVLTSIFKVYYLYSSAISFTVSVLINYWLCVVYVFPTEKKQTRLQATIFFGSSIVGLLLNQLIMWLMVSVFNQYYLLAKIVATAIVMIWNYIIKRKVVMG